MKKLFASILPSAVAVLLAAILAHFVYHFPPDILGALRSLPDQFHADWNFPVHGAMGLLTVLVMWFGAAGIGRLILFGTGAARSLPSFWARWVFATLVGWIGLSLSIFIFGMAGWFSRTALGGLMIAISAIGLKGWSSLPAELRGHLGIAEEELEGLANGTDDESSAREKPLPGPDLEQSGMGTWRTFLVLALYAVTIPYALTPATESDELRYHLAAPEAYLQAGKIIYLPHQAFSNFPFQIEMLFTMAMSLQGTESAKLVHLTFLESSAVLTALIAFLLIRLSVKKSWRALKMYGVEFAYFAGLGFALIPCATILACWAFVDLAVCAYFLAFFYLMILAFVSGERPPAWLAGLMMGGCIATKYSMLPLTMAMLALAWLTAWAVPLISGVLLMRRVKKAGDEFGPPESYFLLPPIGASYLIRTAMVGLLVAAPWFVKSAAWTGNPIYPLAYGVFGGKDWSAANAQFYTAKAAEKGMHLDLANGIITRMIELIISPVATSLFPEKFEGHYLGAIPLMGLALATGGILLFAVGLMKDRDEGRSRPVAGDPSREAARWCVRAAAAFWMGGTIVGSWLFWFLTYQSNRFLLPTIALVLAAGAWGTMLLHLRGSSSAARAVRVSFIGGLIYALIYSGASIVGSQPRSASILGREWMMGGTRLGMPLACALGFESRESYLKRRLGYYAAARWLRERTSPQEKALLIGEHRTLYFGKDIIASDWFDTPQPLDLIRRTKDNNELLDTLKSDGVKFILFNRGELKLYADRYLRPRISPMEFARFDALIGFRNFPPDSRLRPVYRDESGSIEIFEIGP